MNRKSLIVAIFLTLSASVLCAQTGVLSIMVKDVKTHAVLQAKIRVEGPKSLETVTDKDGRLTLSLPAGEYEVTAASLGYRSMTWRGNLWANPTASHRAEISLFPAFVEAPVPGANGVVPIWVRDAITHYAVPAKIELEGRKSLSLQTDGNGTINLPSGEYLVKVSAPGYKTMWWDSRMIRPSNDNPTPLGGMLVSSTPRPEEQWEASLLKPGYTLLRSYATDPQGRPVAGVNVRLEKSGAKTTTNERGYYSFSILLPREATEEHPGTETVIAEKPGYKTIVIQNIVLAGEDSGGAGLDLEPGSGVVKTDVLPMSLKPTDEHLHPDPEPESTAEPMIPNGARVARPTRH